MTRAHTEALEGAGRSELPDRVDCLVVGSGFGGAAVACRVAEAGFSVLLLERGRAYPPGSFPRSPLEVSTNFWDPHRQLYGMFDIWSFRRFEAVVSSGLGGGSLIYANVMLRKPERWFARERPGQGVGEVWPVSAADLDLPYARAEHMLGVTVYPWDRSTPKTAAFEQAARKAGMHWSPAPLAVSFGARPGLPVGEPHDNLHGTARTSCSLCGQCDIGCNAGAKNTTDLTYLSAAERTGCFRWVALTEVRRLEPLPGDQGYLVEAVQHEPPEPLWERERAPAAPSAPVPVQVRAGVVVLAAGTFGSTYLLLRNRVRLPGLSPQLGSRFSGNGDYLAFVRNDGRVALQSSRGPVITSYVTGSDYLDDGAGEPTGRRGFVLQDGGYPVLAEWLAETLGPRPALRVLRVVARLVRGRLTGRSHRQISGDLTEAIGQALTSRGTLPLLGMGRDLPLGTMRLRDGDLDIDWEHAWSQAVFGGIVDAVRRLAPGMDGTFRAGPSALFSRSVTVHPLGGCPMGEDPGRGVVDPWGEVWGHRGLFVADGSVVPGPVGVNPALTIAALGERFATRVIDQVASRRSSS